jgi:hypothetical protein
MATNPSYNQTSWVAPVNVSICSVANFQSEFFVPAAGITTNFQYFSFTAPLKYFRVNNTTNQIIQIAFRETANSPFITLPANTVWEFNAVANRLVLPQTIAYKTQGTLPTTGTVYFEGIS